MTAKRRKQKMQRQRRLANRGPRPPASSDGTGQKDGDNREAATASAMSGPFAGGIPFSNMMAHILRYDGLAVDQLPAGALTEMLRDHTRSTDAKNDAASLGDGCEAWYRWPVGNGIFIDLKLYHRQGRVEIPESLKSHPEVETVIGDLVMEHYIQQPQINRVARQRGAEAALALIDAIPIELFLIED